MLHVLHNKHRFFAFIDDCPHHRRNTRVAKSCQVTHLDDKVGLEFVIVVGLVEAKHLLDARSEAGLIAVCRIGSAKLQAIVWCVAP